MGEKLKKFGHFWQDGLSVREAKFSVLALSFLIGFGFAIYFVIDIGDIPVNFQNLLMTIIYAIAGINIANSITSTMNMKKEHKTQNNHGGDY